MPGVTLTLHIGVGFGPLKLLQLGTWDASAGRARQRGRGAQAGMIRKSEKLNENYTLDIYLDIFRWFFFVKFDP